MTEILNIDEFVEIEIIRLKSFKEDWLKRAKSNDRYPLNLDIGEWTQQYNVYLTLESGG